MCCSCLWIVLCIQHVLYWTEIYVQCNKWSEKILNFIQKPFCLPVCFQNPMIPVSATSHTSLQCRNRWRLQLWKLLLAQVHIFRRHNCETHISHIQIIKMAISNLCSPQFCFIQAWTSRGSNPRSWCLGCSLGTDLFTPSRARQGVPNPWTLSRCGWTKANTTINCLNSFNIVFFLQSTVVSWLGWGCRPQIEISTSSCAFYWRCRRSTVFIMSCNFLLE